VVRIERTENDVSHQLIEELMLLANEAVAARLTHLRRPPSIGCTKRRMRGVCRNTARRC